MKTTRWARPAAYLVLLLVHAELFIRPFKVGGNDWWSGFHPVFDSLRRTFVHYHQFPWWSPWSGGGTPLFALPEIGTISLDMLLVLLVGPVPTTMPGITS